MWQVFLISIWQLSAILLTSSPLKVCQVGWWQRHIFRFLQKYLIAFKPKLGHSRTCTLAACLGSLSIVPSNQSEILNALDWVFVWGSLNILVHWAFLLLWIPQSLLLKNSPTARGCYQHTLLLCWYSAGDEQSWFSSNMMLRIEVHQTRILFLTVWGSFRGFSENPKCVFMCLPWGEDWVWPHRHKAEIGGVLQWCLSFCRFLLSPQIIMQLN